MLDQTQNSVAVDDKSISGNNHSLPSLNFTARMDTLMKAVAINRAKEKSNSGSKGIKKRGGQLTDEGRRGG